MAKKQPAIVDQILRELLHAGPALREEQARILVQRILTEGEEALLFLFLEIARRIISSTPSPSTPSGMIPPHLKASAQTGNYLWPWTRTRTPTRAAWPGDWKSTGMNSSRF